MFDTITKMSVKKFSTKTYEGNYTEEGLCYCQEFGDLYTNNDLRTLKPDIKKTLEEIQTTYGIKEYYLTWGWPMDYDAHIHLLIEIDKMNDRKDLIEKLDNLFPKGMKYVEVRYARD